MKPPTPKTLARGLTPTEVLALTLHHEAVGEGREGMLAVGHVILNRVGARWPTVEDVCLARAQFSCWAPVDGVKNHNALVMHANAIRLGVRPPSMRLAFEIAEALLASATEDPTGGADHYLTTKLLDTDPPSWADRSKVTRVLGDHTFLRLRENA